MDNNKNKKMHLGVFIALLVLLIVLVVMILRFVLFVDYDNLSGHFFRDIENIQTPWSKQESRIENEYDEYYGLTN